MSAPAEGAGDAAAAAPAPPPAAISKSSSHVPVLRQMTALFKAEIATKINTMLRREQDFEALRHYRHFFQNRTAARARYLADEALAAARAEGLGEQQYAESFVAETRELLDYVFSLRTARASPAAPDAGAGAAATAAAGSDGTVSSGSSGRGGRGGGRRGGGRAGASQQPWPAVPLDICQLMASELFFRLGQQSRGAPYTRALITAGVALRDVFDEFRQSQQGDASLGQVVAWVRNQQQQHQRHYRDHKHFHENRHHDPNHRGDGFSQHNDDGTSTATADDQQQRHAQTEEEFFGMRRVATRELLEEELRRGGGGTVAATDGSDAASLGGETATTASVGQSPTTATEHMSTERFAPLIPVEIADEIADVLAAANLVPNFAVAAAERAAVAEAESAAGTTATPSICRQSHGRRGGGGGGSRGGRGASGARGGSAGGPPRWIEKAHTTREERNRLIHIIRTLFDASFNQAPSPGGSPSQQDATTSSSGATTTTPTSVASTPPRTVISSITLHALFEISRMNLVFMGKHQNASYTDHKAQATFRRHIFDIISRHQVPSCYLSLTDDDRVINLAALIAARDEAHRRATARVGTTERQSSPDDRDASLSSGPPPSSASQMVAGGGAASSASPMNLSPGAQVLMQALNSGESRITYTESEDDDQYFILLLHLLRAHFRVKPSERARFDEERQRWHADRQRRRDAGEAVTDSGSDDDFAFLDEVDRDAAYSGHNISAVAVDNTTGRIVGFQFNQSKSTQCLLNHAEKILSEALNEKLKPTMAPGKPPSLESYSVYSSLEPCSLCSNVLSKIRCRRVGFLQADPMQLSSLELSMTMFGGTLVRPSARIRSAISEVLERSFQRSGYPEDEITDFLGSPLFARDVHRLCKLLPIPARSEAMRFWNNWSSRYPGVVVLRGAQLGVALAPPLPEDHQSAAAAVAAAAADDSDNDSMVFSTSSVLAGRDDDEEEETAEDEEEEDEQALPDDANEDEE